MLPRNRNNISNKYYSHHSRQFQQPKKSKKILLGGLGLCVILALGALTYLYLRPIEPIAAKSKLPAPKSQAEPIINWPSISQASFGTTGQGLLASQPDQKPQPTASTAKLITVLTVLQKKPLKKGESGPTITMTQKDVDSYNQYVAIDGSTTKVVAGEKLTQYQMLQGILISSSNNYADTLAIWAFGDLTAYQKAAQKYVEKLGMKDTKVGPDASGFDPRSISTPDDFVKLAVAAMDNQVIKEIVQQHEVKLPIAGLKHTTNRLLGTDGIIGLKTGNTDEAGGVYVFASEQKLDGQEETIVGAVQGAKDVPEAMQQTLGLIKQATPNFQAASPIKGQQAVAIYPLPWGGEIKAVTKQAIDVVQWKSKPIKPLIKLKKLTPPLQKGAVVGTIKYGTKSSKIVLSQPLNSPNWQQRIFR